MMSKCEKNGMQLSFDPITIVECSEKNGVGLVDCTLRREKCDAASELAANTFVIFAGKRRLIAAKLHSFVTQM